MIGKRIMNHKEQTVIAGIIANILVNTYVIIKLNSMFANDQLSGPDAISVWAMAMIWVIPFGIVLVIVLTILSSITVAIITRNPSPSLVVDERDEAFETISLKVSLFVVSSIFIIGLIGLAMGIRPLYILITFYFGYSAGDIIGGFVQMYKYRVG